MLKISSSGTSNSGKKKVNEDNFYMNGIFMAENNASSGRIYSDNTQRNIQFYAVFDGIGQDIKSDINPNMDFHEGETASFAAADMLSRLQRHLKTREEFNLNESVYRFAKITNKNICEYMRQKGFRTGTSFALLCINGNSAYVYNIGNSKIFLLRDNRLALISQNDTRAESLVLAKRISADIVRHTPDNKMLTQYLGMFENEKNFDLHVNRLNLRNGDKFLICSDGLCDLPGERIYQIMSRDMSEQEIVTELVNESIRNGSGENLTMIVVGANYSDDMSSKANLLKPTADGPTHFSPIIFRNKFEFKPKHIKQILFIIGGLIVFIIAVVMLFNGRSKTDDPLTIPGNNTSEETTPEEQSANPVIPGETGNFVMTTEGNSFDIVGGDDVFTTIETSDEDSAPADPTTNPTTNPPVQTTTAAPATNPPAAATTPPPAETTTAPTTSPPVETTTAAPVETTEIAETTAETATTEAPTETEEATEVSTEAPTEPPETDPPPTEAPTEAPTIAEETQTPPPLGEEETIAAE